MKKYKVAIFDEIGKSLLERGAVDPLASWALKSVICSDHIFKENELTNERMIKEIDALLQANPEFRCALAKKIEVEQ